MPSRDAVSVWDSDDFVFSIGRATRAMAMRLFAKIAEAVCVAVTGDLGHFAGLAEPLRTS